MRHCTCVRTPAAAWRVWSGVISQISSPGAGCRPLGVPALTRDTRRRIYDRETSQEC